MEANDRVSYQHVPIGFNTSVKELEIKAEADWIIYLNSL